MSEALKKRRKKTQLSSSISTDDLSKEIPARRHRHTIISKDSMDKKKMMKLLPSRTRKKTKSGKSPIRRNTNFNRVPSPTGEPMKSRILLFRVRLQDDNYKTLTIQETTTACELREKLANKLQNERPDQDWEGCELFETFGEKEIQVKSDTILSEFMDREFVFKRQGEKLANPEEELLKTMVLKRQKEEHKRNNQICQTWFGRNMSSFASEDEEILQTILQMIYVMSNPEETQKYPGLTKNVVEYMDSLEQQAIQFRKKYQNVKKLKKKQTKVLVDNSRVCVLKKIAEAGGSFASIYLVSVDGLQCAMKELILKGSVDPTPFLTEITVLETLPPHPNLVHYLFHSQSKTNIRLFMSLYDESLQDFIRRRKSSGKGQFSCCELKNYIKQIASGIDYLHSFYIMHRDLKSANIFVRSNSAGELINLVVADFDTAIQVDSESSLLYETLGTPGFMAPEVLNGKTTGYSLSGDIYSFGMILFELLFLETPYCECESSFDITKNVLDKIAPEMPHKLDPCYTPFLQIFRGCTMWYPESRPTSSDLLTVLEKIP